MSHYVRHIYDGGIEMDFYITDRTFALQTIVSTDGVSEFQVITTEDTVELATGSRRLTLELAFTGDNTSLIKRKVAVGNYVLYQDLNSKFIWMTILKISHNPLTGVRHLECEDAGLDLLNEVVPASKDNGRQTIAWYINKFTADSGFTIGKNEIPNLTRTLEWESESTALERVLSVATQFDNAEIEFSFEFSGNQLVQRKIDIYKKRGANTDYKLYVNKDINSVTTEEDIYSLVNALRPIGGVPEGKDEPITLKNYNYTDPTGRFKLNKDNGGVMDMQNITKWSRTNTASNFFVQYKTWTTTNQKELLDNAIRYLKEYSVPVTKYVVDIANIPFNLTVGDYLSIVDENEELFLKSRVQKLSYDYTSNQVQAELSDFQREEPGISSQLRELANSLQDTINSSIPYVVSISQSAPFFVNGEGTITLTASITKGNLDVTQLFTNYKWTRLKYDGTLDTEWSDTGREITVTAGTELRYTYVVDATE